MPDGKQAVELITEQGMHFDTVIMDNQVRARAERQAAPRAHAALVKGEPAHSGYGALLTPRYCCAAPQMPVMTGTQATRELREAGFGGLIVGVTGDPEGCEDRNEFNTCGTDVVFDKDSAAIAAIQALIANQAAELRRSRLQVQVGLAVEGS